MLARRYFHNSEAQIEVIVKAKIFVKLSIANYKIHYLERQNSRDFECFKEVHLRPNQTDSKNKVSFFDANNILDYNNLYYF